MARQTNYFSLGISVIVIAILFFAILMFVGGRGWGTSYHDYVVRYPANYPLPDEIKPGAGVHCGASLVGQVTEFELKLGTDDEGESRLWAFVDIKVDQIIQLRSSCRIVARGLVLGGGGKLVILDPGTLGDIIEPGSTIDGAPAATFDAALDIMTGELDPSNPRGLLTSIKQQLDPNDARSLITKIHASMGDLNLVTKRIAIQLNPGDQAALMGKMLAIMDNVNEITVELREQMRTESDTAMLAKLHVTLDTLNAGLMEATGVLTENRTAIKGTMANLQETSDTVRSRIVEPIAQELDRKNIGGLLATLHSSFSMVNASLANLEVVTSRAKSMTVLNESRINRLIVDASEMAIHLSAAGKDLRRNPWRLFYRPSLDETKELNIFDASREFSMAAARLDDSVAQLKSLMENYGGAVPVDAPEIAAIKERLGQTFEDYKKAEEALWNQLEITPR